METQSLLAYILNLLEDGDLHDLGEIAEKLGIPIGFVKGFAQFLVRWGFADFDEEKRRISLEPEFLQLP